MAFLLDNDTTLGGYLSHLQAKVRNLADLDFEKNNHPDNTGAFTESMERSMIRETWEKLSEQLSEFLGLNLKSFNELAGKGSFHTHSCESDIRCFRWNFGKLKKMADKYRRSHPDFTFLKSWDYEAKKRPEDVKFERSLDHQFRHGY